LRVHALIIEEEFFVADLIEDALRRIGYDSFSIALSPAEATVAAGSRCPDLIVAEHDIADGRAIDGVLARCEHPETPVVFVTESAPEVRRRLPEAIVVQKPFLPSGLQIAAREAARSSSPVD
jgi:DNA-binding response OmpR family regulator